MIQRSPWLRQKNLFLSSVLSRWSIVCTMHHSVLLTIAVCLVLFSTAALTPGRTQELREFIEVLINSAEAERRAAAKPSAPPTPASNLAASVPPNTAKPASPSPGLSQSFNVVGSRPRSATMSTSNAPARASECHKCGKAFRPYAFLSLVKSDKGAGCLPAELGFTNIADLPHSAPVLPPNWNAERFVCTNCQHIFCEVCISSTQPEVHPVDGVATAGVICRGCERANADMLRREFEALKERNVCLRNATWID